MAKPGKKWAHEEVCQLIEGYEANPILWDIQHPDYRDRIKKNLVTEKLANNFNCPVSEISRKLHNLRNQVSQELKKMKHKKSGSGTEETKRWPYFSALSFIVPTLQAAATQSNLSPTSSNFEERNEENAFPNNTDEGNEQTEAERNDTSLLLSKKKKTRKGEMEDNDRAITAALQVLAKAPDEHDKFGEYVACELRSIKLENVRRRLKTNIRKAILNAAEEEDAHFMQSSSDCSSFAATENQMSPYYSLPETMTTSERSTTSAREFIQAFGINDNNLIVNNINDTI